MPFPGLYEYITQDCADCLLYYELENTKLIVDGTSICQRLFNRSQYDNPCGLFCEDYNSFAQCVEYFFKNLTLLPNVQILVILNGAWESKDKESIIKKFKDLITMNPDRFLTRNDTYYCASFREDVFLHVLKKLKITFLKCIFNSNQTIATVSKIWDCPVLTANSEFFIHGITCIIFESLEFNTNRMFCKIYRPDKFVLKFPGLKPSSLPFLSILFSDCVPQNVLYTIICKKTRRNSNRERLDSFFLWLLKFSKSSINDKSLQMTLITEIKSWNLHTQMFLEGILNKYTTMSTYMIHHLINTPFEIDEQELILAKNKFCTINLNSRKQSLDFNDDNDENGISIVSEDDEEKKNFIRSIPDRFIEGYLTGKFNSSIINLIFTATYTAFHYLEDYVYDSVYKISLPLILLSYKLVIYHVNSTESEPLAVVIRDQKNIVQKKYEIGKYQSLSIELRNSSTKMNFFNHHLGITDIRGIIDLPDEWRLFVATSIFWYRRNLDFEIIKAHLVALLWSMIFSDIESKFGVIRNYDYFLKRHRHLINKCSCRRVELTTNNDISVIEALEKVVEEDAVMAAKYFIPLCRSDAVSELNEKEKGEVIHIYSQFQCCLEQSRNINALLDYPYFQTIINSTFNRSLMHNLFIEIRNKSNCIDHVIDKLDHAPSVVRVFKLLMKKVNLLLR